MRRDFRVKVDISRIYQDARQYSLIYIDSAKVHHVNQLAEHVQRIFNIKKPFHFLSMYEDNYFYLPFEEDIRVLENNDTVVIVPGTGISTDNDTKILEKLSQLSRNGIVESTKNVEKESNACSEKSSQISEKSSTVYVNQDDTSDGISFSGSLYRTAMHETSANDTKDSQMTEENFVEANSMQEESPLSNKRKRIRKRKQKKLVESVPESDTSLAEAFDKKPRIIDSILISTGKHIRFKGIDEDIGSDTANESNSNGTIPNGISHDKQAMNKDLSALLNLRQSSTPLTFSHKRIKREYKPDPIVEQEMIVETSEISNKSNGNSSTNKTVDLDKSKENSQINKNTGDNDTVSFRVFRMGEDYTPQLSKVILAKVLSNSTDGSQYTLKILHGKEQLQDPEGKFSLPKDEEDSNDEVDDDVVTLEKSKLLEFSKVKALGSH